MNHAYWCEASKLPKFDVGCQILNMSDFDADSQIFNVDHNYLGGACQILIA